MAVNMGITDVHFVLGLCTTWMWAALLAISEVSAASVLTVEVGTMSECSCINKPTGGRCPVRANMVTHLNG
jgi:hypothetical protein